MPLTLELGTVRAKHGHAVFQSHSLFRDLGEPVLCCASRNVLYIVSVMYGETLITTPCQIRQNLKSTTIVLVKCLTCGHISDQHRLSGKWLKFSAQSNETNMQLGFFIFSWPVAEIDSVIALKSYTRLYKIVEGDLRLKWFEDRHQSDISSPFSHRFFLSREIVKKKCMKCKPLQLSHCFLIILPFIHFCQLLIKCPLVLQLHKQCVLKGQSGIGTSVFYQLYSH